MNFIKHLGLCLVLGFAVFSTGCSKNDEQGTEENLFSGNGQKTVICPECSERYLVTVRNAGQASTGLAGMGGGVTTEWTVSDSDGNPVSFHGYITSVYWNCTSCGNNLSASINDHGWQLIP